MIGQLIAPPRIQSEMSGNWYPRLPGLGLKSRAGPMVSEDTALSLSAVFCAADLVASHIAMLPFPVLQRMPDGNRERRREHPVDRLFNLQASPRLTSFAHRRTSHLHAMFWGNAFSEVIWDRDGAPDSLDLLHPDTVLVERERGQALPIYRVNRGDGRTVRIQSRNMLHVAGLSADGIEGYGLIRHLAHENIGLGLAMAQYASSFFSNNMQLGLIISTDGPMKQEDKEQYVAELQAAHEGADKAFGAALIGDGAKVHRMAQDNEAAQVIEQMTFSVQDVARWFGVPPPLLMDLSRGTFSNISALGRWYVKYYLAKWLKPYEQEYSRKLFTEDEIDAGYYLEMNAEGLLRGDPKERVEYYRVMSLVAGMTANEIRERENLNSIGPDGDVHFRPLNMGILGEDAEGATPPEPPPEGNEEAKAEAEIADHAIGEQIARSHEIAFEDALSRMSAIEARARGRAEKASRDMAEWGAKFKPDHAIRLWAALTPCVEAMAGSIRATMPPDIPDVEWDQFTAEFAKAIVETELHGGPPDEVDARGRSSQSAPSIPCRFLAEARERFAPWACPNCGRADYECRRGCVNG